MPAGDNFILLLNLCKDKIVDLLTRNIRPKGHRTHAADEVCPNKGPAVGISPFRLLRKKIVRSVGALLHGILGHMTLALTVVLTVVPFEIATLP